MSGYGRPFSLLPTATFLLTHVSRITTRYNSDTNALLYQYKRNSIATKSQGRRDILALAFRKLSQESRDKSELSVIRKSVLNIKYICVCIF